MFKSQYLPPPCCRPRVRKPPKAQGLGFLAPYRRASRAATGRRQPHRGSYSSVSLWTGSVIIGFYAPLVGVDEAGFHDTLKPQIVSTGLRDLFVPVKDKNVLAELTPDLKAIAAFSRQHKVSGLHFFSLLGGAESVASTRNFAPADGIDEEAATGTSNGALLCYLKRQNLLPEQEIYRIEQGETMGRLSYIYGKFASGVVWVGGAAALMRESEAASC